MTPRVGVVTLALLLGAGCSRGLMRPGIVAPAVAEAPATLGSPMALLVSQRGVADKGAGSARDQARLPIDLPTAIRLAGGRNIDLRILREGIEEAQARMLEAGQWYMPSLRTGVRFNRIDGSVQGTEGEIVDVGKQNVLAGARATATWNLGEGIYRSLAARRRAFSACAAAQAGLDEATLRASEGYFDLLRAQVALGVASESVALYEILVRETESQVRAGSGFAGDVLRARAQLSHARVERERAVEAVGVASARLVETLGLSATTTLYPAEVQPSRLELVSARAPRQTLIAEAIGARPEVRQARLETAAARAEHGETTVGPFLPTVHVGYEAGLFGDRFDRLDETGHLWLGVEWTVGRGGIGDVPRQRVSASRLRSRRLEEERICQAIAREVISAVARVETGTRSIAVAEAALQESEEALRLYRERLKAGVGLPLEVIVAEETLTQARLDHLDAVVDFNKGQMRLLRALGRTP